jgi:hypothetical protein
MSYFNKYIKYKNKYLNLLLLNGGVSDTVINKETMIEFIGSLSGEVLNQTLLPCDHELLKEPFTIDINFKHYFFKEFKDQFLENFSSNIIRWLNDFNSLKASKQILREKSKEDLEELTKAEKQFIYKDGYFESNKAILDRLLSNIPDQLTLLEIIKTWYEKYGYILWSEEDEFIINDMIKFEVSHNDKPNKIIIGVSYLDNNIIHRLGINFFTYILYKLKKPMNI